METERRHLAAFERHFGTRVRTESPNPLSVWTAILHDSYDGAWAFKVFATGATETDVLDRLDRLLAEIGGPDAC